MNKAVGKKKRIVITTATMLAIGGGAAFAYWTATGTGSNSAKAGGATDFTITSAVTGPDLSPGGPKKTVAFTVTNPGSGNQKVAGVDVKVANADGTDWTAVPGCSASDFQLSDYAFTAIDLAPGAVATGTVQLQMVNRDTDQNSCKGVTVPLHFAVR